MSNKLLIEINADAKNAQKAFDDMRAKTEDLDDALKSAGLAAGIVFAGISATIYTSVKAFEDAEKSSIQLTNALQNQGIYTKELLDSYESMATALQKNSEFDDDAIKKSFAIAQAHLKQTEISADLAQAIVDLGAKTGDLNGAAERIAITIGTGRNAFARQGLVIADTATEAERYAKVLEYVRGQAANLGAEFNKADGYTKQLANSFGNAQEAVGSRFAPAFAMARQIAASFFDTFKNSPILIDLSVALISAVGAASLFVAGVSGLTIAWNVATAAAAAFGVTANLALGGIPLIIGAIVGGLTLLVLNWDKAITQTKALITGFGVFIIEKFEGIMTFMGGLFTANIPKMKEGLAQVEAAATKSAEAITEVQQRELKKRSMDESLAEMDKYMANSRVLNAEKQHQANLRTIRNAETELMRMQNANASEELIALKTKEIEVLKALDTEQSAAKIALLRERRSAIKALQLEEQAEDIEQIRVFSQIKQETQVEVDAMDSEYTAKVRADRLAMIQSSLLTESEAERKIQEEILKRRADAYNQDLLNRKKYGESVAAIMKVLNSEEILGAKTAAGELVALTQSKNETLKGIGKVAAVTQIGIATAESAMNIYRGFSTIPIVGPALGIAAAAAAVAFGGERIGNVLAAADGGEITGGIPGVDSVPTLTMPGELIVPTRNFDEVVGAVQSSRAGGSDVLQEQILEQLQKMNEKTLGTTVFQGDLMADDSYIDRMVDKFNEALEFRNKRLFGVNS